MADYCVLKLEFHDPPFRSMFLHLFATLIFIAR